MATNDDRLYVLGQDPLERIHQQLIVITLVLQQAFGSLEDDINLLGLPVPPMNPPIPPSL